MRSREDIEEAASIARTEERMEDEDAPARSVEMQHLILDVLLDIRDLLQSPPLPRIELRNLEVPDKRNRS